MANNHFVGLGFPGLSSLDSKFSPSRTCFKIRTESDQLNTKQLAVNLTQRKFHDYIRGVLKFLAFVWLCILQNLKRVSTVNSSCSLCIKSKCQHRSNNSRQTLINPQFCSNFAVRKDIN